MVRTSTTGERVMYTWGTIKTWEALDAVFVCGVRYKLSEDVWVEIGGGTTFGAYSMIGGGTVIGDDVFIGYGATIGNNALIGSNVVIGDRSRIGHKVVIGDRSILRHNVVIGNYARTRTAARIGYFVRVGSSTAVGSDVRIENNTCIGRNARIGNRVIISNNVRVGGGAIIGNDVIIDETPCCVWPAGGKWPVTVVNPEKRLVSIGSEVHTLGYWLNGGLEKVYGRLAAKAMEGTYGPALQAMETLMERGSPDESEAKHD